MKVFFSEKNRPFQCRFFFFHASFLSHVSWNFILTIVAGEIPRKIVSYCNGFTKKNLHCDDWRKRVIQNRFFYQMTCNLMENLLPSHTQTLAGNIKSCRCFRWLFQKMFYSSRFMWHGSQVVYRDFSQQEMRTSRLSLHSKLFFLSRKTLKDTCCEL